MQQYIIDFVNSATEADINAYLDSCGATIIKSFNAFEKVVLVECLEVPPASDLVEHIKDDDHTNHIKLLTTIPIQMPVLPAEGSKTVQVSEQKDWWKVYSGSVVDLDAPSFQLPLSGAGSVVYLLDSGIKLDHPEFEGADIECLYSLTDDFVDRKGHGTALASVIVGKTCGITNAKLKVVKLFDTEVPTRLSDFLGAMDAVYNDFATNNSYGIMNCSWAIARNEYIEAKMQALFRAGIQIVVASGNDGSDIGDVTPAAMPESIVVGAYNSSLLPCDFSDYTGTSAISVTSGSTNGGKLSGWAPGEDIYAAKLDGSCGFSSGTSISAAIHSAIIAYNVALPPYQFDDSVNAIWNNATRNNVSFLAKRGLLMLDDPKYENSPNLVSLLITDMSEPYKNARPALFAAIFAGAPFRIVMFNPMSISSVILHDPLPSGMSINQSGILSGYVDSVEGDEEEHTVSLSITDLDGNNSDGILKIRILKILPQHTRASYDVNPIIPYQLNLNNCVNEARFCSTHEDCVGFSCDSPSVYVCSCPTKPGSCACRERDPNPAPFAFTDIALNAPGPTVIGTTNTVNITGIVGPITLDFRTANGSLQASGSGFAVGDSTVSIYVNGIAIPAAPVNNMSFFAPPNRTNQTQFQKITVYNNDAIYVEYQLTAGGDDGDGAGTSNIPLWTVSNDSSGNTVLDTFSISGSTTT